MVLSTEIKKTGREAGLMGDINIQIEEHKFGGKKPHVTLNYTGDVRKVCHTPFWD